MFLYFFLLNYFLKSITNVGDLFIITKGLTYGIKKEIQIYNSGCISNSDCNNNST
jgi:hypothetical protein